MFDACDVVQFNYLWAHQADDGEESGRYARPVCVVVKSTAAYLLFPITTVPPAADQPAVLIPHLERRRAGLDLPCWLIPTEFNRVPLDAAFNFASTEAMGAFSPAFMQQIAQAIRACAPNRKIDRA